MDSYVNFDLRVDRLDGGRFRVSVRDLSSPDMEAASIKVDPPFQPEELEALLERVGMPFRDFGSSPACRSPIRKILKEIGDGLFRGFFRDEVREFWNRSREEATKKGVGLRLRLRLDDPEISCWPWELLRDPKCGFLAESPLTPVTRYVELSSKPHPIELTAPIRILVAIAQPAGHPMLDVEQEWEDLERACEKLGDKVVLERLEGATLAALNNKLQKPFHVLHFVGHGAFIPEYREGVLLFEKDGGQPDPVPGETLATFLRGHSSLRLVVLNACQGALGSRSDPFGSVAESLVLGEVPAVIAMRASVTDGAAIRFAQSFYELLAQQRSIDAALSETRKSLISYGFNVEWAIPVLYMRSEGQIIPEEQSPLEGQGDSKPGTGNRGGIWPFIWKAAAALIVACISLWSLIGAKPEPPPKNINSLSVVLPAVEEDPACPPLKDLEIYFSKIKPGTFTMGSRRTGKEDRKHKVTIIRPFCMARHEITQKQWKAVMGNNPSANQKDENMPVEKVSWDDAQLFIQKLNENSEGLRFRLPTEAEWEYAARAGSSSKYSFGNDEDDLPLYGNCESGEKSDGHDGLAPAGSLLPNKWGLFDMHGNVSEWVQDWKGDYLSTPVTDPKGPETGDRRVRRGGSWKIVPEGCTSAKRNDSKPDYQSDDVGVRIVMEVKR